jgi:hypothetical protein
LKQEKIFCEHTPWYFHSDQPGNINTTHTTWDPAARHAKNIWVNLLPRALSSLIRHTEFTLTFHWLILFMLTCMSYVFHVYIYFK